ncbi:hypothetical protein ACVW0P_001209 [Mucilaginibacter sp. UYNi724]
MLEIDQEKFDRNLLLTQIYCEDQLASSESPVAEVLRSFNPEYKGEKIFSYQYQKDKYVVWAVEPWSDDLYDKLFDDQLRHKESIVNPTAANALYKGRILIAEIDSSVTDGASEAESDGFIDIYDCPPIDTWFYKSSNDTGRVFYAWIPERFVELTQNAIDVNALECFTWEDAFVLRKEANTPYHYTYQTQFPPAKKNKNTFFWILAIMLLIRLIVSLVK